VAAPEFAARKYSEHPSQKNNADRGDMKSQGDNLLELRNVANCRQNRERGQSAWQQKRSQRENQSQCKTCGIHAWYAMRRKIKNLSKGWLLMKIRPTANGSVAICHGNERFIGFSGPRAVMIRFVATTRPPTAKPPRSGSNV
jgi:hypothetical protein